ncbi:MAG TPA: hypothetical protein VGY66_29305 [Gemmataceae bacterium]|jgi:hypothetical protein|nr:hypothetical protein [Gemmataceae bacterium]
MSTENRGEPAGTINDLVKLQLDYAWKWFDFHAKQRTTLFNYFLIITGIFANAIVAACKEGYDGIRIVVSLLGALTSIGFLVFDVRNRALAREGEDVLAKLEDDVLFPPGFVDKKGRPLGLLSAEARAGTREGQTRKLGAELLKHKWWIRGIEIAVAACFILLAWYKPRG